MSPAPEPRRRSLRGHAGVTLQADAWGDPDAAPVLLLHGGGQTRHSWGDTAAALAQDGWYVLNLDLRGHGDSEWPADGDYGLGAFVSDVVAVASSCATPPALVGASLGGLAALVAAAETRPPIGSALVLVDVAPRLEREGALRIVRFMTAHPEGFESLDAAADAITRYLPHRQRKADARGLEKNLRRGTDGRWRWHWDPRFLQGVPALRGADGTRMREAARQLRLPTLLVRGRLSDVLSEEGAREFLALAPGARYEDVSGAGHMVAGDRNDAFTQAVCAFLHETRIEAGGARRDREAAPG